MRTHVEKFDITCSDDGLHAGPNEMTVFGIPFHKSEKDLIKSYINNSRKDFFKMEQRRSCGNYILYDGRDSESIKLITSPGYSSGYIYDSKSTIRVSSLLSRVVESWRENQESVDTDYLRVFLNEQRPFQGTPFGGVSQLRPASFYQIELGEITEEKSYLTSQTGSPSVTEAYHECAAALSDKHVSVMFSGGLDSLSWYLALRNELNDNQVNLITVDWRPDSKAQGPYLARPIADRLGVDLDIVSFDDGWMTDNTKIVNHITSWMKNDITRERNPNHALADFDGINDIIINLTNNESILTLQMNHYYLRDLLTKNNTFLENVEGVGSLIINQILHNTQYTSKYMRNLALRTAFIILFWPPARLIDTVYPAEIGFSLGQASINEIDTSQSAIIESIVAKVSPNVQSKECRDLYNLETNKILEHICSNDIHHQSRLIYYYAHMAWASNILEKMPLSGKGVKTYLPTTWGPMLSSSLFEDLTMVDSLRPRQELLKIVKEESGYSFDELRRLPTDDQRTPVEEYKSSVYSSIFAAHKKLLSPDQSMMLANMNGDDRGWYEDELRSVSEKMKYGENQFHTAIKASRMINLELLLDNSL
jgi:hypothetical protein